MDNEVVINTSDTHNFLMNGFSDKFFYCNHPIVFDPTEKYKAYVNLYRCLSDVVAKETMPELVFAPALAAYRHIFKTTFDFSDYSDINKIYYETQYMQTEEIVVLNLLVQAIHSGSLPKKFFVYLPETFLAEAQIEKYLQYMVFYTNNTNITLEVFTHSGFVIEEIKRILENKERKVRIVFNGITSE